MKRQLEFIKTTAIGGFVFLIPAVIVVIALGKLIGGLKTLAKALSPIFGGESSFGGFVLDIVVFDQEGRSLNSVIMRLSALNSACPTKMNVTKSR